MRTLRALLALSLMTGSLVVPTSIAHAQSVPGKEIAKKLFEDGVDLEKKSDYVAALAKYREAEQIAVTPGLRFHKAYCLEMMGKLSAALEEYEAAEKVAREANRPDVRAAVIARLDPLRARVPQLTIRLATVAKDAEVQLDGAPVGAPLLDGTAFRLDPGEHAVTARAPGHRNFVRRVQLPEGLTTTVEVVLDAATAPAAASSGAPATEPPSEAPPRRSVLVPVATTVGAVVLVVTGVAFIAVAGSAQTDAKATCPQKATCDSERSKVRTLDAFALGSFVGAAGLGVLSAVLWTSKGRDAATGASIVARPAFAGGSVGVEGSF